MIAFYPDGTEKIFKLLSSDPKNYSDAANEAIRRILEEFEGVPIEKGVPLDLKNIGESLGSYGNGCVLIVPRIPSHGNHCSNQRVAGEAGSQNGLVHYQGIQGWLLKAQIANTVLTMNRTCLKLEINLGQICSRLMCNGQSYSIQKWLRSTSVSR